MRCCIAPGVPAFTAVLVIVIPKVTSAGAATPI
jgi:hypothetical protein